MALSNLIKGLRGPSTTRDADLSSGERTHYAPNARGRLSFSQKFARLMVRLRDPEWRRYGTLLFAGKSLGVATVLLAIVVISGLFGVHVLAAEVGAQAC